MENIENELKEAVIGTLYLPKNHTLKYSEASEELAFREVTYDPAFVDEETLNFKFLMPAIEASKNEPTDFIVGFSSDLKRVILAYKNPDDKFQAFNAHQQAALFAEYFLTETVADNPDAADDRLVVKSLLLSNQIDNIVKKNEGRITYSHAGYESLRAAIASNNIPATIAF